VIVCGDIPWQQFVESVDRVVGDSVEHLREVCLWFDAVELGSFDQGVDRRGAVAAGIGTGEQLIFSAQGQFAFILPISVRKSRSTIAGIRIALVQRLRLCPTQADALAHFWQTERPNLAQTVLLSSAFQNTLE